ncbi:putative transmembrane protein [Spiroplasma melliferum IPMB4A]|uniref:hypothetical protein n=1 Tax=Spiroplasma melliferum TaxID=2134 RepID=UPI0002A6545C|nr:hypothetical protein [Spiroplasma melliferum]ELL44588.1 putative transmembrane protein [Spiroplasma melliferum IPMB4A]
MKVTTIILGTLGTIGSVIPAINTFSTNINPTTVDNMKNELDNMDSSLINSSKMLEELKESSSSLMDDFQEIFNAIMGEDDSEDTIVETVEGGITEAGLESNIAETALESNIIGKTVESGLLTSSLGTAATTIGVTVAIALAIYGGYYTYTHWDDVKTFSNKAVNDVKHYISTTTDYLKNWLFF